MPFPFGKSQKSPADIVRSLKENVAYMEKMDAGDSKKCEKVSYEPSHIYDNCLSFSSHLMVLVFHSFPPLKVAEEVSKNLASLKEVLSGTGDKEPQTEAVAQLAQELYNTNLLIALIANLQRIDFGGVGGGMHFFFLQRLYLCLKY
uniref:Calcium-binding protein 39 n=1 Tax=Anoplopoma fimbria TaxID=229290 RepID=C3KJ49_ANOFI|nr:Calcium-binding protein 39 [Anoplopoma fimbria]